MIKTLLEFNCSCSRCLAGNSTDAALKEISKIRHTLDNWALGPAETISSALKLIHIFEQEGLDNFADIAYGYAALAYNAIRSPEEAKRYAKLAIDVVELREGCTPQKHREWQELVDNPQAHWSWGLLEGIE